MITRSDKAGGGRRKPTQTQTRRRTRAVSYLPTRSSERHLGPCFEIPFKAKHVYSLSHLERGPAPRALPAEGAPAGSGERRSRRRPRGATSPPRAATPQPARRRRDPRRPRGAAHRPAASPAPRPSLPPVAPFLTGGDS